MSKLGQEILSGWEGRPLEKMQYIHDALKDFLIEDIVVKRILTKFGPEIFRRSTIPLCYGDLALQQYMTRKPVKVALEIGTWNGVPSAVMSQFAEKVITIDIEDRPEKYKVWKFLRISDKIEFHLVKNEIDKEKLLNDIQFDFCYMDGNHMSYTYSDWMMVRKCGRVLFHEYWDKQSPVMDLVNSLPANEVEQFELKNSKKQPFAYWEQS